MLHADLAYDIAPSGARSAAALASLFPPSLPPSSPPDIDWGAHAAVQPSTRPQALQAVNTKTAHGFVEGKCSVVCALAGRVEGRRTGGCRRAAASVWRAHPGAMQAAGLRQPCLACKPHPAQWLLAKTGSSGDLKFGCRIGACSVTQHDCRNSGPARVCKINCNCFPIMQMGSCGCATVSAAQ